MTTIDSVMKNVEDIAKYQLITEVWFGSLDKILDTNIAKVSYTNLRNITVSPFINYDVLKRLGVQNVGDKFCCIVTEDSIKPYEHLEQLPSTVKDIESFRKYWAGKIGLIYNTN